MSTQIDLGPVLSVPKGDWNAATTYERLNIVRHNSSSWICNVATSKGVEPTEDSTDWYLQVKDTSSVTSVNGMKGDVVIELTETETPPANDNSNRIATTEWVTDKLGDVDLSGIKDDTVLAAQNASSLEVGTGELTSAELAAVIENSDNTLRDLIEAEKSALKGQIQKAIPVGTVVAFAANSTPDGFLLCNGAAVSRTTYAKLFEAIGTTYGAGNGSSTFNLPNLTDRFIQGNGTAGTTKAAGLPEIKADFGVSAWWGMSSNGAISSFSSELAGKYESTSTQENMRHVWYNFSASRYSSVYGASNTVQPPALTMRFYIKY